ncbi:MAG: hypothetical protein ISR48_10215 [Alphaproteobacteria bacterium]|nr:hypothetical protein [Alphaproteobacteria bacterium]
MAVQKVPVRETVEATYRGLWTFAGRLGWVPWLTALVFFMEAEMGRVFVAIYDLITFDGLSLLIFLAYLVLMLANLPIFVTAHRLAIADEEPDRSFFREMISRRSLEVLGCGIFIFFVMAAPIFGFSFIHPVVPSFMEIEFFGDISLMDIAGISLGVFLVVRFALIVPAAALGKMDTNIKYYWRCTRGNAGRIFGVWALAAGPLWILEITASTAIVDVEFLPVRLFCDAAIAGISVLSTLLSVRVVSFVYIHLVRHSAEAESMQA